MTLRLAQIKQYLGNNLWYGENDRSTFRALARSAFASGLLMPDPNTAWGIDISHWNVPPVALERMRDEYGLMFVIIKGCDGTLVARYCDQHVALAKSLGLPFGLYNWLYPNNRVSIDAQTTAWANLARTKQPNLPTAIDAENTTYGGQPANPTAADLRMAHDLFRLKHNPAMTYTSPGYADAYLQGYDWTEDEPMWIAHWGVEQPTTPDGATWEFHQYGILDGKQLDPDGNYELDGNKSRDSRAVFAMRYGGVVIPPQPPEGGTVDKFMKVTDAVTASLNIRTSGANLGSQNDLGAFNLLRGDIIHVVEINSANFARFDALYRNGVLTEMPASPTGQYWSLTRDSTGVWLTDVEFTPPAPPTTLPDLPYAQTLTIGGGQYEEHTHTITGVLKPKP